MGIFERFLSIWVALAITAGVLLGLSSPDTFTQLAKLEIANVNVVIALLIWLMIFPMMLQIDFGAIKQVGKQPMGLFLTLMINWLIKPFSMALLGWLFFELLFAPWIDPQSAKEYIAGMILLGVAPCTAMVFVWSHLTNGNANYTLVQVSLNDIIMVFAFAPLTALLLGINDIIIPWQTLLASVVLYVILPLIAGIVVRSVLNKHRNPQAIDGLIARLKPWSIVGLLATVTLLFGFQANTIIAEPLTIALIAIPLTIQTYAIFFIAYFAARWLKLPHNVAGPASMIGTSNFFELAVAVAISLFGLYSGAALATVVGVLVEVPIMLSLVAFVNKTKHWFNATT